MERCPLVSGNLSGLAHPRYRPGIAARVAREYPVVGSLPTSVTAEQSPI
jgi:hypothetical protein